VLISAGWYYLGTFGQNDYGTIGHESHASRQHRQFDRIARVILTGDQRNLGGDIADVLVPLLRVGKGAGQVACKMAGPVATARDLRGRVFIFPAVVGSSDKLVRPECQLCIQVLRDMAINCAMPKVRRFTRVRDEFGGKCCAVRHYRQTGSGAAAPAV